MKSLTIIQETRAGMLAEITTLLEHHDIDLRGIDGSTAGNLAVINLTAEPGQKCYELLTEAGYKVYANEQILVKVKDRPGALAEISRMLANVQVDIKGVHVVGHEGDMAVVALATENDFSARQVLRDILI